MHIDLIPLHIQHVVDVHFLAGRLRFFDHLSQATGPSCPGHRRADVQLCAVRHDAIVGGHQVAFLWVDDERQLLERH